MIAVDLLDFDTDILDLEILEEYPASSGSWYEPAKPELKLVRVKEIGLTNLSYFDDIDEVFEIKPNDYVKIKFNFCDTEFPEALDFEGMALVNKISIGGNRDQISLKLENLFIQYQGAIPPQSQAGR